MKVYGYARTSTAHQNLTRQRNNLKKYSEQSGTQIDRVFEDQFTGTTQSRPGWQRLLRVVQSGDTIVFDEVSRMSRNAEEGFADYKRLYEMGVDLVFLKQPTLNTSVLRQTQQIDLTGQEIADKYISTTNEVLWLLAENQIRTAFEASQKEVDFLHQRVSEGIRSAIDKWEEDERAGTPHDKRKPGRQAGTTFFTKKGQKALKLIWEKSKTFQGTETDENVISMTKLSRTHYYRLKKYLKENGYVPEKGARA